MASTKRPKFSPISTSVPSERARAAIIGDSTDISGSMSRMGELPMNDDESNADQAVAEIPVLPSDIRKILDKISHDFDSQRVHEALAKLRHAPEAAYDIQGRKGCMENTRVGILDELISWSEDPEAPTIFWLSGMAGTGKTSIAYSFCAKLVERARLGGSFFCNRSAEYSHATRIIPSLAYRLARQIEQFRLLLAEYLDHSDDVSYKGISVQIEDLLRIHFSSLRHFALPHLVLVIDALDECSDKDAVKDMMNALISAAPSIPIKFFVTSRPDQHIRDSQLADGTQSRILKLHEIHRSLVDHDIRLYFQRRLVEVFPHSHPRRPTEADIKSLVRLSGQLFIFASTAIEYIRDGDSMKRLQRVIKLLPSTPQSTKSLYAMYQLIIDDSLRPQDMEEDELDSLSEILASILVSRTPLSVQSLSTLLRTDEMSLRGTLDRLHAVLRVPDDDNAPGLSTLHASFEDFLTSSDRVPRELLIDRSTGHKALVQGCFHVMLSQLHFNMCKLPSSYFLDADVENLLHMVENNILCIPGLEYACRYWTSHLMGVTAGRQRAELWEKLENLCQEKILFWIEVMNLLGAKTDCYNGILAVQSWVARAQSSVSKLQTMLDAVVRLCSRFTKAATCLSTPHLYISSLATEFGTSSDIPMEWKRLFPRVTQIRFSGMRDHGGLLSEIHTEEPVNSVAFSSDGAHIVSGSENGSVRIWDVSTGKEVQRLEGHTRGINSVAFSPDGTHIASASWDQSVRIWDASTGKEVQKLEGHMSLVDSVAFSPDGAYIVSGSWDRSVRIWDVSTGKEVRKLKGHMSSVNSVAFSPDGAHIVSGSWDRSVRIWDALTGKGVQKLECHTSVKSVAFSPDGAHIVLGSWDGSVRIWDVSTGKEVRKLEGHTESVKSVAFSPYGAHIISGSGDKSVRIWDASTGKEMQKLDGHMSSVNSVAFSPDGTHIISGSRDQSVRIWDVSTGKGVRKLEGHMLSVNSVAFSPDGVHIVSGSWDKSVRIWDVSTGKEVRKLEGHTESVNSVAFSPNGAYIVSCSRDRSVRIWDVSAGDEVQKFEGHALFVNSTTFSPDGAHIVSGSRVRSVRTLNGHTSSVYSVAFSPDSTHIVSGSQDTSVRIWDVSTGKEVRKLKGHTSPLNSVAFSPDGTHIVAGSFDRSVRIWDVSTGKEMRKLEGHTSSVKCVAFSPDGTHIVSGSEDRSVRICDVSTGKEVRKLEGHTESVKSVAFSPDGTHIVSGSDDRSVRIWDLSGNTGINWTCGSDGWITNQSSGSRLLWLPTRFTSDLQSKYCSAVFSREKTTALQFSLASLGVNWVHCYQPDSRRP